MHFSLCVWGRQYKRVDELFSTRSNFWYKHLLCFRLVFIKALYRSLLIVLIYNEKNDPLWSVRAGSRNAHTDPLLIFCFLLPSWIGLKKAFPVDYSNKNKGKGVYEPWGRLTHPLQHKTKLFIQCEGLRHGFKRESFHSKCNNSTRKNASW